MERVLQLLADGLEPLTWIADPSRGLFWPHVGSACALALLVSTRLSRGPRRRLMAALCSRRLWLHRSSLADLRFWLVDAALSGLWVGTLVVGVDTSADAMYALLVRLAGQDAPVLEPGPGAALLLTVAVVVAADAGFFVSHWLRHFVPFLWEFHKVHHSAEVLTPITSFRIHPIDQILNGSLAGMGAGLALGVFDFLYAGAASPVTFWGVNAAVFAFNFAGANLRHSHIPLSFGWLDRVFVSPVQHQIHHSVRPEHWNRNLGSMLSIWDALAGTRVLPDDVGELRFGIGDGSDARYHGVVALYVEPFRGVTRSVADALCRRTRRVKHFTAPGAGEPVGSLPRSQQVAG